MTVIYADASAFIRAYFPDETEHAELRALLLETRQSVVTSELTRLELASAAARVYRSDPRKRDGLLARFELNAGADGLIALLPLRPAPTLCVARDLIVEHRLRALDAIHLAVALEDGRRLAGEVGLAFVTRDREQADVARSLGLGVR